MPTATDRVLARVAGDEGSATVEFIALSVVVLIPLVYLMIFVSQVQASAYAAVAAADQAAKVVVSGTEGASSAQAHQTVLLTLKDYGITRDLYDLEVDCSVDDCMSLDPGEVVSVRLEVEVPLPLVPASWGDFAPATVGSDARAMVPRF